MLEKQLMQMMNNEVSPYALLSSLIVASSRQNANLTPEEKAEREEKRRLISEQRMRDAKIVQNICPDCGGKLARGKKEKKNDYKRTWDCMECGKVHMRK